MSEDANYDTSADENGNNKIDNDPNERNLGFQILITVSLIVGPIFLPFIFLFPNSFSWFPYAKEISIIVLLMFIFTSIVYSKLKSK